MQDYEHFFRTVLPQANDGLYLITRGRVPNDGVFMSLDQLINYTKTHDIADGNHTWWVPAVFNAGSPDRSGKNIAASQTFVLDIDINAATPEKTFTSLGDAVRALTGAVDDGVVPVPSFIISSGGGIHVYWATNRPMSFDEHKARATTLVQRLEAVDRRFTKDGALTRNAAALFRLPGGINFKYNPAPRVEFLSVEGLCDNSGGQYGPDAIADSAGVIMPPTYTLPNGAVVVAQPAGTVRSIGAPAALLDTAADMFNGCAVLAWIYMNQANPKGHPQAIGYHLWRNAIALLSYTKDGHKAAHAISHKWPDYNPDHVNKQFAAERNQYGAYAPILCSTLCNELPFPVNEKRRLCTGCAHYRPHRGTPYQAAKDKQIARHMQANATALSQPGGLKDAGAYVPADTAPAPAIHDPLDEIIVAAGDDDTVQEIKARANALRMQATAVPLDQLDVTLPSLMFDNPAAGIWFDTNAGHTKVRINNKDDPDQPFVERLSDCMIYPLRFVSIPNAQGIPQRNVQVLIYKQEAGVPKGRIVELLPAQLTTRPDNMAGALSSVGVFIEGGPRARAVLMEWLTNALGRLTEDAVVTNRDSFGWVDEGQTPEFVYGDFLFGKDNKLALISKSHKLQTAYEIMYQLRGSVRGARSVLTFVGKYGSDEMRFAIAAAAGAPFMKFSGTAGAFVNLWGPTGKGKSLTGSIISSMFGNGALNGALISSKDTINARYAKLSAANSLPAVHEEATPLIESLALPFDPQKMGDYLYAISEGAGKGRSRRDGALAEQHNWSTLVFGTSNNSVWQKAVLGNEQKVAEVSRAFELHIAKSAVDLGDDARNNAAMKKLGDAAAASSGAAGLILSRYYVEHYARLRRMLEDVLKAISAVETSTSAEQRTRRAVMAVAVLGGYILKDSGLWDVSMPELQQIVTTTAQRVSEANARNRPNHEMVMADILQSLQGHTAVLRPPLKDGEPRPFGLANAAQFGLLITPRNDLKVRIELRYGDRLALVFIRKEVFDKELRSRGIDFHHFTDAMIRAGYQIEIAPYAIHRGVSALERDNAAKTPAVAPDTLCVAVWYNTNGPTQSGEPPSIAGIVKA